VNKNSRNLVIFLPPLNRSRIFIKVEDANLKFI
jgi:hypothetical protein